MRLNDEAATPCLEKVSSVRMMGHAWVDIRLLLVSLLVSFPGLVVLRAFLIVFCNVLASVVDSLLSSEGSNYQVILYLQFFSLP